ncbi:MAG: O-antigen ligase family protein [Burkholderiales bacterium]
MATEREQTISVSAPARRGGLVLPTVFLAALLFLLSADLIYLPIAGQKFKYGYFLVFGAWALAPSSMLRVAGRTIRGLPWYTLLPLPPLVVSITLSANVRDSIGWALWLGFDAFTVITVHAFLKAHAFSASQVHRSVLLAVAAIAACGMTQFVAINILGNIIWQPQMHFDVYRINGVSGWPHFLNICAFLLLPILLAQRPLHPLTGVVIAVLVYVLVQSTAKTGWVLFIALGCLLLLLDRPTFTKVYVAFLLPITAIALLLPQPTLERAAPAVSTTEKIERFSADLNLADQTSSGRDRLLIGIMGLKVWAKHPWFGVGPRAYDDYVFTRFDSELAGANKRGVNDTINAKNENIWIELLAENGLLFTLAFVFLVARALYVPGWEFGNRLHLGTWIALVLYFGVSGQFSQTGLLTLVYAVFGLYFYAGGSTLAEWASPGTSSVQ